jgi:lipopolysaccharide export system permease protein
VVHASPLVVAPEWRMILIRYLLRTLLTHMVTVLLALLALIAVFNFIEQLDDVGTGTYTVVTALQHSLLMLPAWALDFAPAAALLGALSGLGRLQQDSEITILRSSGWSVWRLAGVAALAGVMLAGLAALIGESVAPGLAEAANRMKTERKLGPGVLAGSGAWWTMSGSRVIGIDRRPQFPAATIIEFDDGGQVRALAEADTISVADGRMAYERYRVVKFTDSAAAVERQPRVAEDSPEALSLLRASQGARRHSSLQQLAAQRSELERARLPAATLRYEYHERLAKLVTAPLLVLLALPAVLGLLRSARQGARIVLGLVVGFALSMLQDVASSLVSVYGVAPAAAAWMPAMLTATIAAVLLWRLTARPRVQATGRS